MNTNNVLPYDSTKRQEVLKLTQEGLLQKEIAAITGVSVSTVRRWQDPEKEERQREYDRASRRRRGLVKKVSPQDLHLLLKKIQKTKRDVDDVARQVEDPVVIMHLFEATTGLEEALIAIDKAGQERAKTEPHTTGRLVVDD